MPSFSLPHANLCFKEPRFEQLPLKTANASNSHLSKQQQLQRAIATISTRSWTNSQRFKQLQLQTATFPISHLSN